MVVLRTYRDGLFLICSLRYIQMGFPCLTGRQNWTHLVIMTLVIEPWPIMYRQYRKEQWYHFGCRHWVNIQSKTGLLLLFSMENQIFQSPFYILLLWSYTSWANLYDNDVIKNAFQKWNSLLHLFFFMEYEHFLFSPSAHSVFQLSSFFFYSVI